MSGPLFTFIPEFFSKKAENIFTFSRGRVTMKKTEKGRF